MIKALEEEPEKCGYSEVQIANGLNALASKPVKQIGSDAAHLYHMLLDKELIEKNEFTERAAKKHAEIMKFRFDHERSNLEDMPEWVRKPLFNILGQYADGAVERADNKWIDIELNDDFLNKTKYKFHER